MILEVVGENMSLAATHERYLKNSPWLPGGSKTKDLCQRESTARSSKIVYGFRVITHLLPLDRKNY